MTGYERSTTATSVDGLPEPLRAAVWERAETALIRLSGETRAYLTRSVRLQRPGLLSRLTGTADRDAEHYVALVLAPSDVLVAIHVEQRGTSVLHARLEDCIIDEFSRLRATARAEAGDGFSLSGFPGWGPEGGRSSFWIGTGPPDGEAARTALIEAIRWEKRGH